MPSVVAVVVNEFRFGETAKVANTYRGIKNHGTSRTACGCQPVVFTATPALAARAIAGTGGGTGWEYPGNFGPVSCPVPVPLGPGVVPGDRFELNHFGTFEAANAAPGAAALYEGPSVVVLNVGTHVVSAAGVGPTCVVPLGPVPIQSATLYGASGIGSVQCSWTTGFYERVANVVTFTLLPGSGTAGKCSVEGNRFVGNVLNVPTVMTITGTLNPCFDPPPFSPSSPNPECTAGAFVNPPSSGYAGHFTTAYEAAGAEVP